MKGIVGGIIAAIITLAAALIGAQIQRQTQFDIKSTEISFALTSEAKGKSTPANPSGPATPIPITALPTPANTATTRAVLTNTFTAVPQIIATFTGVPTAAPTQPPATSAGVPPACTTIGQTWTSPVDGMVLVCVPANKFMMGAAASDTDADSDERPQNDVSLSAYWIDRTEVSNRQFELFVKATNYQTDAEKVGSGYVFNWSSWVDTKGAFWRQPKGPGSDLNGRAEHPVVLVSWNDADAYCRWAKRGLPTEAQWEMAARGTDGRTYPWGNAAPDASRLNFNMNVKDTTQVGKYPSGASPYGALDMAGNVWEWVADWYGENYYRSFSPNNPTGPANGYYRVLRGGSWYFVMWDVRASSRYWNLPGDRNVNNGFRCGR